MSRSCSITTTVAPVVDQALEHAEQHLHIKGVQADGGLVKHKERVILAARELACQL